MTTTTEPDVAIAWPISAAVGVHRDLGSREHAVDAEPQRLARAVVEIRNAVARARAGVAAGQQRDGGGRAGVDVHGHGLRVPRGAVGRPHADENAVDAGRAGGGRHGRHAGARRHGDRQVVAFGIDDAGEVHRRRLRRRSPGRVNVSGMPLVVVSRVDRREIRNVVGRVGHDRDVERPLGGAAVAVADDDRHVRRSGGSLGGREHQRRRFPRRRRRRPTASRRRPAAWNPRRSGRSGSPGEPRRPRPGSRKPSG